MSKGKEEAPLPAIASVASAVAAASLSAGSRRRHIALSGQILTPSHTPPYPSHPVGRPSCFKAASGAVLPKWSCATHVDDEAQIQACTPPILDNLLACTPILENALRLSTEHRALCVLKACTDAAPYAQLCSVHAHYCIDAAGSLIELQASVPCMRKPSWMRLSWRPLPKLGACENTRAHSRLRQLGSALLGGSGLGTATCGSTSAQPAHM
eukprot:456214-Pelagomonas_calceolata.AAC.4